MLFAVACKNETVLPKYTVSFDAAGGSEVKAITVDTGAKVSKPVDPTRVGYLLVDWYLGEDVYDFDTPVSSDITLKAVWGKAVGTEADLRTAIEEGNSSIIVLTNDVAIKKALYIDGNKNIELDMNRKKISLDADSEAYGIITVKGKGKLKITGNGFFGYTDTYYNTETTAAGQNVGYIVTVMDDAELTVDNGSFYGAMGCIRLGKERNVQGETAKAYINGGEFKSEVKYANHYWTFNKMDGTTTEFVITGGKFLKFNPAKGGTENPDEDWVAKNCTVEASGDYFIVKSK